MRAWYEGDWHVGNPRIAPIMAIDHPGFLTDLDLHSPEARRAMPVYSDF